MNAAQKLIQSHLIEGEMVPGQEIGLKIDQVLQQDATGTLVMLELESLKLERTKAEVAVQYVDHNLLQTDYKNADDHIFLKSAAEKFGYWFSPAGNGISHPVHMERFGKPGKTLLGSDSHTCSGGAIGMLAIGTGGLDVALASSGEPYAVKMPKILGVHVTGKLPEWKSAKDVVLEMLRRYDVKGLRGYIVEYYGEGLKHLSAWDRHVIANMGVEMGATATVFPSDEITRGFLKQEGREEDWSELAADPGCEYDTRAELNLSEIESLIALPSSPGNVVPVREVAGEVISQAVIGSSANPGLRDFWIAGQMVKDKNISFNVSFEINPSSRQIFQNLILSGGLEHLLSAGARLNQTGCMGCIGMGQAPASDKASLRTMPRNFPGRSGTENDKVYLCSPETATASALTGFITDPASLEAEFQMKYPQWEEPEHIKVNTKLLIPPKEDTQQVKLEKGPNIQSLPDFSEIADRFEVPVLLKMGDNISTDEILKAGSDVLPLRSNIEALSKYAFWVVDKSFYQKSNKANEDYKGHVVVGGENYAQGSSREHAALCPRYLGQQAVLAKSYARIGWQNLVNYGIVPLEFTNEKDYDALEEGDIIRIENLRKKLENHENVPARIKDKNRQMELTYSLSERQIRILLAGGLINHARKKAE